METLRRRPAAMPSGGLTSTPFPGQSHDERYSFAASCRIVRRPAVMGLFDDDDCLLVLIQ